MLQGAMSLRRDGVVEGEIKGQVFSLGEDELVRGETGFEAVSDDDDDDCIGNHQSAREDGFRFSPCTIYLL